MRTVNRHNFDETQINRFFAIFDIFDVFCDGQIARRNLLVAIDRSGYYATDEQIEDLVLKLVPNEAGLYTFQHYVDILNALSEMNTLTEDELLRALRVYDKDKSGFIQVDVIVKVIVKIIGPSDITKSQAISMVTPFTQNGQVDYHKLAKAVTRLF